MRMTLITISLAALITIPMAPVFAQHGPAHHEQAGKHQHGQRHHNTHRGPQTDRRGQREYSHYDYNRPDPRYGNYHANRYYVAGNQYRPRRMTRGERIYRGSDNRYYCRRSDGTTGLIIGGITGGVLGNAIAPGGSKTLGALLGGGIGALLGQSVDRGGGDVTCR